MMSSTRERPLADVLLRAWEDSTPARPERAPWHQPTLRDFQLAATDNRVTVNLAVATRVRVHDLGRPTGERDDVEWFDWTPRGWGVGPSRA
jgi:hypothetical protein